MSKIKIFSLGGLNENGKNMYVVKVDEDIFVFDAGLKYDNDLNLGIDYIIPSFDYLIKNKKNVKRKNTILTRLFNFNKISHDGIPSKK